MFRLLIICLSLIISSCSEEKAPTPKLDVVVGISDAYPPFEYTDPETGDVIGLDIDLIKRIGQEGNFNIVMQKMKFHSLIPSLHHGDIDMSISAMSPDISRSDQLDFSAPYHATQLVIIFKIHEPFASLEDLNGKKVAIEKGTIMAKYLQSKEYDNIHKFLYTDEDHIIRDLNNDIIDAAIVEGSTAANHITQHSDLAMTKLPSTIGSYAIAFPKGSKLKPKVDEIIFKLTESGELAKMHHKHKIALLGE